MKKFLCAVLGLSFLPALAQTTYLKHNIDLLALIKPDTSVLNTPVGNRYSGCWGWYQASKNREYAISGGSSGTFFIDVTVPTNPVVVDVVPGKKGATWREMKTYQNYCYIVSDDPAPNMFQIVDMKYLPDSVHVVHSGTKYFEKGHTIWIDNNRMYIGATSYTAGSSAMTVWSLDNPEQPLLLRRVEQDIAPPILSYVHDMFVRNDTVFASCAFQGLHVLKFENADSTFTHLGSYVGYPGFGYNHSSSWTQNGKYLVFCDEVPTAVPIHLVDVQNLGNIQPLKTFKPSPVSTPHNPYVLGNQFVVVSCYQDGLQIFDISNPAEVNHVGYFDTYPQGGVNTGEYPGNAYSGNWGAYPYLPSGIIIANDMQNGVFILDATAAFTTTVKNPVGVEDKETPGVNLIVFPNPASDRAGVHFNSKDKCVLKVSNMLGQTVFIKEYEAGISEHLDLRPFPSGCYNVCVTQADQVQNLKLIVQH